MARHAIIDLFFSVFKTMISQMIRLSQYDKKKSHTSYVFSNSKSTNILFDTHFSLQLNGNKKDLVIE